VGEILRVVSLLAAVAWSATGAEWWNKAWSCRKRVRVRLAPAAPLGFDYRPPDRRGDEVVAAEAVIQTESPLKAGPANEVRVVDSAGNLLPCVVSGPDSAGLLHVVFPARRVVVGQVLEAIGEKTTTVRISPGRDKAVQPGMAFTIFSAWEPAARLVVEQVEAKTARARVVERNVPAIAKGTAIRSEVITDAEYSIYYGNPNSKEPAPGWKAPSAPVTQYGWRISSVPMSVEQLRAVMRGGPGYIGARSDTEVNNRSNPFDYGSETYYVSAYEGMVHCDFPGLYRFSIDSGGPAYLFVDGRLAAQRPGFFLQTGQFEHRGKIELDQGVHHFVLLATENARRRVTRLAWQPVTATVFSLMPESAFTARVPAVPVGYETRDGGPQVFFTVELPALRLKGPGGTLYQFAQFRNRSPMPAGGAEAKFFWDFGDGDQSRQSEPEHLYTLAEKKTAFKVALRVVGPGGEIGAYQRTVFCTPRRSERLNLALEVMSFANIAYDDEKTTIAARVRSANHSPVMVRAVGRLTTSKGKQVILNSLLPIAGQDENFCILPLDLKEIAGRRALVDLEVLVGKERVLSTGARVVPSDALFGRGTVKASQAGITLKAEGPLVGLAYQGQAPSRDYELAIKFWASNAEGFPSVVFPTEKAARLLRAERWAGGLRPQRAHDLRLKVTGKNLEVSADGKMVLSASLETCPPAAEALGQLAPLGVAIPHGGKLVLTAMIVRSLKSAGEKKTEGDWLQLLKPPGLDGFRPYSPDELDLLRSGLGALFDHEGRRVMLCAEVEDPDRHLRWVFARYIHEQMLARRWRLLLFGDAMSNLVGPDESFTDYVGILKARFERAGRPFDFVPRSSGVAPALADIILFGNTLKRLDPLPDIIVLCPGLGDVAHAVGLRDFVRSFDVMIDLVRATGKSIQVIIVSPPPSPWNRRLSADYARALRRLARDHHVHFVDLHELMTRRGAAADPNWAERYYSIPETDGLYFENPNEAAQKLIADAIEKALQ